MVLSLPEDTMKHVAEMEGVKLRLKARYGAGFHEFHTDRAHVFVNDHRFARGLPYFTAAQRVQIILDTLRSDEGWGADLDLSVLRKKGALKRMFALHVEKEREDLLHEAIWKGWWNPVKRMPLMRLREYLGSRVTLYLAWLAFYARMLIGIAAISVLVELYLWKGAKGEWKMWTRVMWGIAVCFWGSYWFEYWKRRNAVLNVKWGLLGFYEDGENDLRVDFQGVEKEGFYTRGGFVDLGDLKVEGGGGERRWVVGEDLGVEEDGVEGEAEVVVVSNGGRGDKDFTLETPVTGLVFDDLPVTLYSSRKQVRRRVILTSFVTAIFAVVIALLSVAILFYKHLIIGLARSIGIPGGLSASVPGVTMALLISSADAMWKTASNWLTGWENQRTLHGYEDSLIAKRFAFQFVSNYVSLYYVAFIKPFTSNDPCLVNPETGAIDCMYELETLLTSLVITKATVQQVMEVGVPFVTFYISSWLRPHQVLHQSDTSDSDASESEPTESSSLLVPASDLDPSDAFSVSIIEQSKRPAYKSTMEDYGELVIQHGHFILFGLAFPLAAVVNLFNNVIETRTDTYKILSVQQRPDTGEAADIGRWLSVLNFLSIVSVITTSALLTITTPALQLALPDIVGDVAAEYPAISFLVFEHVLLGVRWMVGRMIKDRPGSTYRLEARQSFLRARCFGVGWKSYYRGRREKVE